MIKPKRRLTEIGLLAMLLLLTGSPVRSQTTAEQAQKPPLIPATVSEQAQAFYARAQIGSVPAGEAGDPERLDRIRNMLGRMFQLPT